MSQWLEKKYLNLLGPHLRNFKRKSDQLYNWSCTYCGDSQKNPRKARAYAYKKDDKFLVTCHNCSLTVNIPKLLKDVSPILHTEFVKEMLAEKYQPKKNRVEEFTEQVRKSVKFQTEGLWPIVNYFGANHAAHVYIQKRMIPKEWWPRLYYSPKFFEWTNTMIPEKFSKKALQHDEGRLVIPLISKDKKIFGYQGRSLKENLDKNEQRYYTIILDDTQPKIFGLDRVDLSRKHYVLEGPIDAMFIPNSIATAGGGLYNASENAVFVFDNEPRNKDTCKKIQKAINLGYKVCIWPDSMVEKDVNELVINNCAPSFVKQMIDERTYSGMEAQLVFDNWRKI